MDAIIVLGNRSPAKLSDTARLRVDKAVELYRKGIAKNIIMSGSHDILLKNFKKTEACLMKEYAIQKGVPSKYIIKENKSIDTITNAYYVKKILEKKNWKNIIIVTSKHHCKRSRYIFKKVLGNGYRIQTRPGGEDNAYEEKFLLKITRQFLDHIKDGDDRSIKKLILSPIFKSEEFRKKIMKKLTSS